MAASGLAALARCAQVIRSNLLGASDAVASAARLRESHGEAHAEAALAAFFSEVVYSTEEGAFRNEIARLHAQSLTQQTQLAVAAQMLKGESDARQNAERALADANARLGAAQVHARQLVAQAADFRAQVARLCGPCRAPSAPETTAGLPLTPGPLPPRSLPPGPLPPRPLPLAPLPPGPLPPGPLPASPAGARTEEPHWSAAECAEALAGLADCLAAEDAEDEAAEEKKRERGDSWACSDAKRARGAARDNGEEPRYWPVYQDRAGLAHAGGYKIHVQDVPRNITRSQIDTWLAENNCPIPAEVNPCIGLSPCGRGQLVLTFDFPEQARQALGVLSGSDLEAGKHRTQTKWFQTYKREGGFRSA